MLIRQAVDTDWPRLWPIVKAVVDAGETYVWRPTPVQDAMRDLWMDQPPWQVVVAELDGVLVGTAKFGPNRPGRGAHIATASFMVDPATQGRGVGRALGEHVISGAREAGYLGMQFNAVVSTNTAAVSLWRSLGFAVIGTVPRAFDHEREGLVDLLVMYRDL